MRRLGSKEKSTIDPVDLSSQGAASRKESKGRTLLLKIHLLRYSISWEELDCLFARFGRIECIEVFCPGEQYHPRIRFQQKESAIRAFESFNHRDIYDRCCRLELFLEAEIDDGASKIETPSPPTLTDIEVEKQGMQAPSFATAGKFQDCQEEVEASLANANQEIDASFNSEATSLKESDEPFLYDKFIADLHTQSKSSGKDMASEIETTNQIILEGLGMDEEGAQIQPNSSPNAPKPSTLLISCASVVPGARLKGWEIVKPSRTSVNLSQGCSDPTIGWGICIGSDQGINIKRFSESSSSPQLESETQRRELQIQSDSLEVIPYSLATVVLEELVEMDVCKGMIADRTEQSDAYKVFVEMPRKDVEPFQVIDTFRGKQFVLNGDFIFDPGIASFSIGLGVYRRIVKLMTGLGIQLKYSAVNWPYDRGKETVFTCSWMIKIDASIARVSGLRIIWMNHLADSTNATDAAIDIHRLLEKVLVFDPGGNSHSRRRKWGS